MRWRLKLTKTRGKQACKRLISITVMGKPERISVNGLAETRQTVAHRLCSRLQSP